MLSVPAMPAWNRGQSQLSGLRIIMESAGGPVGSGERDPEHHVRRTCRFQHPRSSYNSRHRRRTVVQNWKEDAFFLVADAQGRVVASLGPPGSFAPNDDLPMVRAARRNFPKQALGFVQKWDELFQVVVTPVYVQSTSGPVLLNVLVAGYRVDAGWRRR